MADPTFLDSECMCLTDEPCKYHIALAEVARLTAERGEDSARLDWMEANKVELGHASVGNLVLVYVRHEGFMAVLDGHGIREAVDVARRYILRKFQAPPTPEGA